MVLAGETSVARTKLVSTRAHTPGACESSFDRGGVAVVLPARHKVRRHLMHMWLGA